MEAHVVARLVELNRQFYSQFGPAFAATRQRLQNGVRRILDGLPDEGAWLDLGCGSGTLALAWLQCGRRSSYLGLDFSAELLAEARAGVGETGESVRFAQADLTGADWAVGLAAGGFRGVMAFAALHHIPSQALRSKILGRVNNLLEPGGSFIHSEWQFQHSPKMLARRQPWSAVGLSESDLESGDTLLDWRFTLPGRPEQHGLRYVHLFDRLELAELAAQSGFEIIDEFESDGHGGRLGLYQVWRKRE
jgi:tRNA (uracil-5-)-methyltransferase TRM9